MPAINNNMSVPAQPYSTCPRPAMKPTKTMVTVMAELGDDVASGPVEAQGLGSKQGDVFDAVERQLWPGEPG